MSLFPSWHHHLVIDNRSADPFTPPRLRILSQDRRVHVQFGQVRLVLDATIRLRIHQWYVLLLRTRTAKANCPSAAKRGAVPHLAVATEQGTVYIWNTSKREALEQG